MPGWLRELTPNDAELARTGLSFTNGFCNTAMCSPSRATLFTGRYPAEHGVRLTLTAADLRPDPRNTPAVLGEMAGILRSAAVPPKRVLAQFGRGLLRLDQSRGGEAELDPKTPNLPRILAGAGYTVAYKGKWHLTHPSGASSGEGLLGGWTAADGERIERDYGFADWEAPDAGENAKAANFGGGNAGEGEGWDEVYIRQVERWLARESLPEPFCLVVSLVNPHDVLGYPAQYEDGGYTAERVPRARGRAPADRRRGPARKARRPLADEDGDGRVPRAAQQSRGAARLRQLLRLPAPGDRREDRPPAGGARRRRRSRVAALADDDRPHRRPR